MYDVKLPSFYNITAYIDWCGEYIGPQRYSRYIIAGEGWRILDIVKVHKHTYIRFNSEEDAIAFSLKFEL